MTVRIKFQLLFFFFAVPSLCSAQVSLYGKVVNKRSEAIPYANIVILLQADSSFVQGAISDSTGAFVLNNLDKNGHILRINHIGYQSYDTLIRVNSTKALKTITLLEGSHSMPHLKIAGKRDLIVQKIDRLVVDIAHSTKAMQGDALEVLRVTPGVNVQDNSINIIGKSGVQVTVNDKLLNISSEDLVQYLKSIPSDRIKAIEVITSPPAKYNASGNSGIINIQLKKALADSWNTTLRANYMQRRYANGYGGISFNYNKQKLSFASSFFYRNGTYWQDQDDFAYFDDGIWYTKSPFTSNIEGLSSRIDLSYQVKNNWSIGLNHILNQTTYHVKDMPSTSVSNYETNAIEKHLQSEGTASFTPLFNAYNINTSFNLDSSRKKIDVNFDYFTYGNSDSKEYSGLFVEEIIPSTQYYRGTNTNNQETTNFSSSLDFEFEFDKMILEFGGKSSWSKSDNSMSFYNSGFTSSPVNQFELDHNDFEYLENIQALYISSDKKLNEYWRLKLGARMEMYQTQSSSKILDFSNQNDYLKVFPTFYLVRTTDSSGTFNINYNRRITRPQFFDLNPNIYFVNPFQTIEGNPFLTPSFSDNLEFSHQYKNLLSKIYFSHEENIFGQVPLANSTNNEIRFTNQNFIRSQRIGIMEYITYDKFSWFTSNNSLNLSYVTSQFSLEQAHEKLLGFNLQLSTSNDFKFNLESGQILMGNLGYRYSPAGLNGIYNTKWTGNLFASIQFLSKNKNLHFSVRANDILKTDLERWTTTVNGVDQEAIYYYDSQNFTISMTYKFGNKMIYAKRHSGGNSDEKNRINN